MLMEKYDCAVREVMDRVRETQRENIEKAADMIVKAVKEMCIRDREQLV